MRKIKKAFTLPKITPTVQVYLAVGLFALAVAATEGKPMTEWEIAVFEAIYNLPDFLLPLFFVVTQLGSVYMLALLLGIYLVRRKIHILLRLLMTGTTAYLVSGFAKDLWGRTRPHDLLVDVMSRDHLVRGPGFPSGHTALAVALAFTVAHYAPKRYKWVAPAWIIGVGLSRVYLGIHAPLDIIGGFAIGWFCYALFRHVRLQDLTIPRRSPTAKRKHSARARGTL